MLKRCFQKIGLKKDNNIIPNYNNLSNKDWHRVMIRGNTAYDLATKVKSKQFPVWCDPLLQHSSIGDSMLELGSGTGELSAILGIYGRIPLLLDFSEESIDYTKALFKELGIEGHFYCENILGGMSLKTSSVDWVWSSGLLEHFSYEKIVDILKESPGFAKKVL